MVSHWYIMFFNSIKTVNFRLLVIFKTTTLFIAFVDIVNDTKQGCNL